MAEELENRIDPFTVRDALIMHDKRINQLTDLSHETQTIVRGFEEQMKTLLERINKGVSPTMQQIKDQNSEIKTQIVEFKGDVNTRFKDMEGRMNVSDEHFETRFGELKDWTDGVKGLVWKISAALIIAAIFALFGMYSYVHSIRAELDPLIASINRKLK
jgi:hypothetical protein